MNKKKKTITKLKIWIKRFIICSSSSWVKWPLHFFLFCLDLISKYFFSDIYFWFFSSLPAGYSPNLLSSVSLSLSPGKLGFSRWQKMGEKLLEWTVSLIAAWDMYKYIYPFCRVDFVTNSTRRPLISNDGGTQQTHTNTHTLVSQGPPFSITSTNWSRGVPWPINDSSISLLTNRPFFLFPYFWFVNEAGGLLSFKLVPLCVASILPLQAGRKEK